MVPLANSGVSGFMTIERLNGIFDPEHVSRLEVTWNSDTLDMIRCKHIIKAFQEEDILNNVNQRASQLKKLLSKIEGIEGLRMEGLIIGFDLKDTETRNKFMENLYKKGMICNSTGPHSIRLRPNLCLSSSDTIYACELVERSLSEIR